MWRSSILNTDDLKMLCALLYPNLLIRTISNMRFGPHDWHLVEMPHFAWIWISLQSSFMVLLPIFAEFSNPNIHLYIVPVKGIGKAPIILKLPSLSANCLKTCPKSSSEKYHISRDALCQSWQLAVLLAISFPRDLLVKRFNSQNFLFSHLLLAPEL